MAWIRFVRRDCEHVGGAAPDWAISALTASMLACVVSRCRLRSPRVCSRRRISASMAVSRVWLMSIRSEEHTSELQSLAYLVCRLLLEKKKKRLYKSIRVG